MTSKKTHLVIDQLWHEHTADQQTHRPAVKIHGGGENDRRCFEKQSIVQICGIGGHLFVLSHDRGFRPARKCLKLNSLRVLKKRHVRSSGKHCPCALFAFVVVTHSRPITCALRLHDCMWAAVVTFLIAALCRPTMKSP